MQAKGLEQQIIKLAEGGMPPEQICEAFPDASLTVEAIEILLRTAASNSRITADELLDKYRIDAINYLGGILQDHEASDMAKVKAADILISRKGSMAAGEAEDVAEMFKRAQELKARNDKKIIELPKQDKVA
jgi:hypothetical protein